MFYSESDLLFVFYMYFAVIIVYKSLKTCEKGCFNINGFITDWRTGTSDKMIPESV